MAEYIMIQERLARLEEAASAVIELMRTASQPEDVARGSIDRFARAELLGRAFSPRTAARRSQAHRLGLSHPDRLLPFECPLGCEVQQRTTPHAPPGLRCTPPEGYKSYPVFNFSSAYSDSSIIRSSSCSGEIPEKFFNTSSLT